jgi:hypothetical protein
VPFCAGPRVLNRPHAITADADIPSGGAEGVLLCQGSGVGGWSFYLKDGKRPGPALHRRPAGRPGGVPGHHAHRLQPRLPGLRRQPDSPITPAYQAPFRFAGTLYTATIDLSGDLITDTESAMRVAMARQ